MDAMIWGLGLAVMMLGGLGIAAAVGWWAIDRVLRFWMDARGIYNVAVHARKHGLDLRTGKPFADDNSAH